MPSIKSTAKKAATPAPDDRDADVYAAIKSDPGTTIAGIAGAVGKGRSTVTKSVARLESAGMITRTPGGHDGIKRLPDQIAIAGKSVKKAASKKGKAALAIPAADVKLGKGELAALVAGFMAESPGDEYGPSQIAKVINRSAGAIANALDKMAADGNVILTGEKPRRYRIIT